MEILFCDWPKLTYAAMWHTRSISRYFYSTGFNCFVFIRYIFVKIMQTHMSCLFLTVIGFIHTSLKERDYRTREKFRILKESRSTDIGIFILSVYVSVMPFSGSQEQVFVKLFGTKGESEEVCIQSKRLLIS